MNVIAFSKMQNVTKLNSRVAQCFRKLQIFQKNKIYINIRHNNQTNNMESNSNWLNQPTKKLQKAISNQFQQPLTQARQPSGLTKCVQNYQFCLGNIIARNQFSQVYYGIRRDTKQPVAIKVTPMQKLLTSKQRYDLQNEIKMCKVIPRHKNLVAVIDTYSTANNYYVMMQMCNGDLKTQLLKRKTLSQQQVVSIMLDVIEALRHLTMNNYMHCNVKPSNILIAQDGTAKLTDFSSTRKLSSTEKPVFQPNEWTPYMSPLTLVTRQYQPNNDTWALGVTLYQCLYGYHNYPWKFENYSDLLQKVYEGKIQYNSGRKVSQEMVEFMSRLLGGKGKEGMSVVDVYNDTFVKMQLQKRNQMKSLGQGQNLQSQQQQPTLFKNFSNNSSPQHKPLSQEHFMKFRAEDPSTKVDFTAKTNHQLKVINNPPLHHIKRHVSHYETSSSPHKASLRNQFTFIESNNHRKVSPKQILDCEVAFMRFINIVLKQDQNGYVPQNKQYNKPTNNQDTKLEQIKEKKQIDHQLFRFVLIKQVLGQKEWLKRTLDPYHPENVFNIDGVEEFLAGYENRQTIKGFRNLLHDYDKKYFMLEEEMQRLIVQISSKLSKTKREWRPRDILTQSLQRKEILPILGVRLARELCKHIWHELSRGYAILQTHGQGNQAYRSQIIAQMEEKARRVDFLMTYYTLNCLLIDNFSSPQHFVRNSGLQITMNNKPVKMELEDFRLVEEKLRLLEII